MFQLSKRVEYALIAMRHMAITGVGTIITTKEISDRYSISHDLLAKVMQTLARTGFISSYQGVRGGYVFRHDPRTVKVSEIINAIEGRQNLSIIQCESETPENCVIHSTCTIKTPLVKLQSNLNSVLDGMSLMEMV